MTAYSNTAFARARSSWSDFPDLRTLVRAADINKWDARVAELSNRVFYPEDFGTVTTGTSGSVPSTDSVAAINGAVTAAYAAGGGLVPLPAGTMRQNTPMLYAKNVAIIGQGRGNTQIYQTSTAGATNLCQSIDNTVSQDHAVLRDFSITGNGNVASNTGGIVVEKSSYVEVSGVQVSYCNNFLIKLLGGNSGGDCQANRITNCYLGVPQTAGTVGILLQASASSAPDFAVITHNYLAANIAGVAFKVDKGTIGRGYGAAAVFAFNGVEGWPTIWDIDGNAISFICNNFEVVSGTMSATTRSTAHRNFRLGNTYATYGDSTKLTITDSTTAGLLSTNVMGDNNGDEIWNSFGQPAGYASSTYSAARELAGSGSPEGVYIAPVGSTFRRTNGGAGTSFYIKESGTGNVGWVAK